MYIQCNMDIRNGIRAYSKSINREYTFSYLVIRNHSVIFLVSAGTTILVSTKEHRQAFDSKLSVLALQ